MFGQERLTAPVVCKVLAIVFGVLLASAGEVQFSMVGVLLQLGGLIFESIRVVMIQVLMSDAGMKMDPIVSLYYYAPVCALINLVVAWFTDWPSFQLESIATVGPWLLFLNALVALLLNISSVLLVCIAPLLLLFGVFSVAPTHFLADWQNIRGHAAHHRCRQKRHPHCRLCLHLGNHDIRAPDLGLQHHSRFVCFVQGDPRRALDMGRARHRTGHGAGHRTLEGREARPRKEALCTPGSVRMHRPHAPAWIGPASCSHASTRTDTRAPRLAHTPFPCQLRRDVARTSGMGAKFVGGVGRARYYTGNSADVFFHMVCIFNLVPSNADLDMPRRRRTLSWESGGQQENIKIRSAVSFFTADGLP